MPLMNTHGERCIKSCNVVVPAPRRGSDAADEVFASGQIDGGPFAENKTQGDERLRREPVVVIIIRGAARCPNCCVAHAAERSTLDRDPIGQPPLSGRAQR